MRKRSNYKPKPQLANPLACVINGFKKAADVGDPIVIVRTKNHLALDAVLKGVATRQDIDVLISAVNIAEALCWLEIGDEYRRQIDDAHEAILKMTRRGLKNGERFVFTGEEMKAVKFAIEIHDAQLDMCTIGEMEQAIQLVYRTIKAKKATLIEEVAA